MQAPQLVAQEAARKKSDKQYLLHTYHIYIRLASSTCAKTNTVDLLHPDGKTITPQVIKHIIPRWCE
jgi:hypothetical protein